MRRKSSSHHLELVIILCAMAILVQVFSLTIFDAPSPHLPEYVFIEIESQRYSTTSASLVSQKSLDQFSENSVLRKLLRALQTPSQPKPQSPFDREKIATWVDKINLDVSRPEILPTITLDGNKKIAIFPGQTGLILPRAQSIDTLLRLDLSATATASLTTTQIGTTLSPEQIQETEKFAQQYIGKSLALESPSYRQVLQTKDIFPLIIPPNRFSDEAIDDLSQLLDQKLATTPIEPELILSSNGVEKFTAPKDGRRLDKHRFSNDLRNKLTALEEQQKTDPLQIEFQWEKPKKSLASTNTLGITERIGLGESAYSHSIPNRIANVSLTTKKIHAKLILPGEEFSFNQYLGEVSAKTGFKPAYVIKEGQTVLGDGGGVCQVSSTLFRAVLNSGLPITQRRGHSYRVGYYEQNSKPGFDATVFSPNPDFRFVNDTQSAVLVNAVADPKTLTMYIELWGTSDGRIATILNYKQWGAQAAPPARYQDDPSLKPGQIKQVDFAAPGLKTSFDYVVTFPNGETRTHTFSTSYTPWAAVYLRGV